MPTVCRWATTYTNDIGYTQLSAVWKEPGFKPSADVHPTLQERA
jgi:hypothetical protein